MASSVKSRRSYDSPRRREQAAATRAEILDAALASFVERGYVATTIAAVAERVRVSPETVYAVFKTKRALLSSSLDVSIVGDADQVPLLERGWVQELREEPDARRRMRILARNGRGILERVSPIYEVLREASSADPEVAAIARRYEQQRFEGQRALLRIVAPRGTLRSGLGPAAAADILYAIGSPESYRLLVLDRGWTPARFERWYADTLIRLLLIDGGSGNPR
jgi:AcrR family transcriptional regulator